MECIHQAPPPSYPGRRCISSFGRGKGGAVRRGFFTRQTRKPRQTRYLIDNEAHGHIKSDMEVNTNSGLQPRVLFVDNGLWEGQPVGVHRRDRGVLLQAKLLFFTSCTPYKLDQSIIDFPVLTSVTMHIQYSCTPILCSVKGWPT